MTNTSVLCNNEDHIKKLIPLVNWNFNNKAYFDKQAKSPFNCRKHHWYPGTFPAELPFSLIEILTQPSAAVLDPFSGIGTTFFQSLILGRQPIAVESCHISYQFLKSFIYLLFHYNLVSKALFLWEDVRRGYNPDIDYTSQFHNTQMIDLKPWYEYRTFNELCYIKDKLNQIDDPAYYALLFIVISNSLVRLSSQNKGWGYIADNVFPKENELCYKSVFKIINNRIKLLVDDLYKLSIGIDNINLFNCYNQSIFQSSIFDNHLNENLIKVDTIITSPPYPNMADYALSQRLSYYYWDFPLQQDIINEFGARRSRNLHGTLIDYENRMLNVNSILVAKLKHNGYLCYIMPEFTNNPEKQAIIANVINDLKEKNMKNIVSFTRMIPSNKRLNNASLASLLEERITILRKE